jgi:hypothetical protein
MAELSAADRAHVVQHLEAASRWLELLSSRLADGGEAEAAALTDAAWADINAVCARLRTTCGLPVDPHRASTPQRRWLALAFLSADEDWRQFPAVPRETAAGCRARIGVMAGSINPGARRRAELELRSGSAAQ